MAPREVLAGAALGASCSSLATLALLRRYLSQELRPPALLPNEAHRDDPELLLKIQLALRDYWPHPLLEFSGYISTCWMGFRAGMLPAGKTGGRLELLSLSDGGTVSLEWAEGAEMMAGRTCLLLPGMNNDSTTTFVQQSMESLVKEGFCAVALNYRGIGGLPLTSPRFGCSDNWSDLPEVVAHVQRSRPKDELFAMGFSMGGGMLLRYLGEEGSKAPLKAAVTVAAPVDYHAVAASLASSLKKKAMAFSMTMGLKAFMLPAVWRSELRPLLNIRSILAAKSLREFEEATICPVHGYRDSVEYYEHCTPRKVIQRIRVPTLILHAEDDPVVSVATLPRDELARCPALFVAITRRGGHIGWGSGGLGGPPWTDAMALHFMQACAPRSRL